VNSHEQLVARVDTDLDNLLAVLWIISEDHELNERLWTQLVDLLVESMLLDLRSDVLAGRLDQRTYAIELDDLAVRCRGAGLLPLRARPG
jgi:hypothetical protein